LWYKHSVVTTEKLRLSHPAAGKYLLTKTSVDGIEWIIPPSAQLRMECPFQLNQTFLFE